MIRVDLNAPSVTYTSPTRLTVGTAIAAIQPATLDDDIGSYALKTGSTLPARLMLSDDGAISGTPSATTLAETQVTIVVTDVAGNTSEVPLTFPVVRPRPVKPPPPTPTPTLSWSATAIYGYTSGPFNASWTGWGATADEAYADAVDQVLEWALWEVPDYHELDSGISCWVHGSTASCVGFVDYEFSASVSGSGSGPTQSAAESAADAAARANIPDDDNTWTRTSLTSESSSESDSFARGADLPDLPVREPGRAPWWAR